MNQQKLGEFLKYLRKEKGLTQEQIAGRFYVSSRTVSRWETGSNMPDMDMLVALADFYNVDIGEILDGERKSEEMNKEQKENLAKIADYCNRREKMLLRKMIAIIMIGIVAWAASFSFILAFMNSAQGAGFILICETIAFVLYSAVMFCIKTNRSVYGFFNVVIGAVTAVVISNIALLVIFFRTGSYQNYGLIGVYYSIQTLVAAYVITGITVSVIGKIEQKRTAHLDFGEG